MKRSIMDRYRLKAHQLMHWEYWPMKVIYYPLFPVWAYFALRARSFFFFSAANPGIRNGGMALESKKEIYDLIPKNYIPKTILIKKGSHPDSMAGMVSEAGIGFPMIAKPDIGMKAFGVEKLSNETELLDYSNKIDHDFLLQELIEYPNEVGVFYVRFPDQVKGKITGIVLKEFLSVSGDGASTLLELIKANPRTHFQLKSLQKGKVPFDTVLPKDYRYILVPYGSHTRGAKFLDISNKNNESLSRLIDGICGAIPGFYFGRLDIRYNNFEDLSKGSDFSIIEINGAGSEPTHIYDPRHSLFFAWYEISRHWNYLFRISRYNYKKGHPYLSFKAGREMLRANSQLESALKLI